MTTPYTPDSVAYSLECAGRVLLAARPDQIVRLSGVMRAVLDSYGWQGCTSTRPNDEELAAMKEVLARINLIPQERYVLRRVIAARCLVHPLTDRHLFPWRRLSDALGADHKAVQRWHAAGIGMITDALNEAMKGDA